MYCSSIITENTYLEPKDFAFYKTNFLVTYIVANTLTIRMECSLWPPLKALDLPEIVTQTAG